LLLGEYHQEAWRRKLLTYARNMEDFVTWVDSSKIKRNIMKYRDKLDDFELEAL
jgi:hypothetical protein